MTVGYGAIFNRRDIDFQLFDVLGLEELLAAPLYDLHDRQTVEAVLDLAERIAVEAFQPSYRPSDLNPPVLDGDRVVTEPSLRHAIQSFTSAGFMSAALPCKEGGLQLPWSVVQSCYAMFQAANIGASAYYFLTVAAANVLRTFGSPDIRETYLRPLLDGRFLATMCLSEPQAGSSLADIATKAIPSTDGYSISGTKMWISAGDHDLSENIVHLVLARIEGAERGTQGLSLFLVPKFRMAGDGRIGETNNVEVVSLNHKMGYRAATNAILAFGARGETRGYLVGKAGEGMRAMFVMMNEARISVGCGAAMLGYAGYLHSLAYARDRLQGRHPDRKDPDTPQVPLVEHADVRRMLLTQKVFVEGAMALCLYLASLVDKMQIAPEETERTSARRLLDILTPVAKAWPSEFCLEANKLAIQVLGGYGYTIDYPVEQYYRDNRLNLIHEGTNGIQAIDLVGRKLDAEGGALWETLRAAILADIALASAIAETAQPAQKLREAVGLLHSATEALRGALPRDLRGALANASIYADAFGHVCIGWMWLRQARVAAARLRENKTGETAQFLQGKLAACRYFIENELGRVRHWLEIVASPAVDILEIEPSWL